MANDTTKITLVTMYKAFDGKVFDTLEQAKDYEVDIKRTADFRKLWGLFCQSLSKNEKGIIKGFQGQFISFGVENRQLSVTFT